MQAAVARGATWITLRVDADDLELTCDGAPFTAAELSERENALLEGDTRSAGLACLAVGLHTALGLGPRYVKLSAGDGVKGLRLTLRPDAPEALEEVETELRGFVVHVKSALSGELVTRARQDRKGLLPEEQLLRERCRYAPVSVVLEGVELAGGLCPEDAVCPVAFEGKGYRGVGAFVAGSHEGSTLNLLQQGVWLETVELGGLPNGFVAVVEAKGLRKDLSRVRFTQDEAFRALRLAVREARSRSLRELAETIGGSAQGKSVVEIGLSPEQAAWARVVVREGLRNFSHLREFEGSFSDDTAVALSRAPVFLLADRQHPGGVRVPLSALLERAARGDTLGYALLEGEAGVSGAALAAGGPGPSPPSLLLGHEGDARSLGKLLERQLQHDEGWEQRLRRAAQQRERAGSDELRWRKVVGWATGLGIGGLACFYLILGILAGSSADAPEPRASRTREVQALEKACENRSAEACALLARGYEEGRDPYPQSGTGALLLRAGLHVSSPSELCPGAHAHGGALRDGELRRRWGRFVPSPRGAIPPGRRSGAGSAPGGQASQGGLRQGPRPGLPAADTASPARARPGPAARARPRPTDRARAPSPGPPKHADPSSARLISGATRALPTMLETGPP